MSGESLPVTTPSAGKPLDAATPIPALAARVSLRPLNHWQLMEETG